MKRSRSVSYSNFIFYTILSTELFYTTKSTPSFPGKVTFKYVFGDMFLGHLKGGSAEICRVKHEHFKIKSLCSVYRVQELDFLSGVQPCRQKDAWPLHHT